VLPRSNCAAMARGEVRPAHVGIGFATDGDIAALHSSPASLAAQNFTMPALSPTMTEGNIATWKLKEGTTTGNRSTGFIVATWA
jgi:hypothetical protein